MGSFILFIIAVAAPLAAALAVLWGEEKRRSYAKMRVERLAQDNRGLKLALGMPKAAASGEGIPAQSESEKREIQELVGKLAQGGILLDWLRLGTKQPDEVLAQLLGGSAREAAHFNQAMAEWGVAGATIALDRLKGRLSSISEMEMVWADPHSYASRDLNNMADRALWVFEPEYVVGEGRFEVDARLGAVAKPQLGAGLGSGTLREGESTLVVELKPARVTVGGEQQLQAWSNVRDLIRGGAIRDRDPVDVFVIGGAVDEYEGNPRIEGRHRNVRITAYDYGQLITRAKRLTFGLYDELKDFAPFIRHHREEILAEQQAAANQAASQVAVPEEAPEEAQEILTRDESDHDIIRDVEYAEDSEAASADDEPSEPHKQAAQ